MEYNPDKWVGVKISSANTPTIYKIFACWYGGYLSGDSWKLNSGITKATLNDNRYYFEGASGSVYVCNNDSYGTNGYGASVLGNMILRSGELGTIIEILPEDTNWLELNYE
jgi:hypothetical protein